VTLAVLMLTAVGSPCWALDPHSPEVRRCIDRAVAYLRDNLDSIKPHESGIVAYALVRGGESPESPAVKTLVRRVLDEKFVGTVYGKETPHQFYEAGTDMMMFEAVNPGRYRRQLEEIAAFAIEHQWPSGSWYYYGQDEHGGDTSHTQYAVLGLWAASRAGVRVPRSVWSRMANWHLKNQMTDGGFAYHPGDVKTSNHSMTVNGTTSLCIARMMLYPGQEYPSPFLPVGNEGSEKAEKPTRPDDDEAKAAESDPGPAAASSVLSPLDLTGGRTGGKGKSRTLRSVAGRSVPLAQLNRGIHRGAEWIRDNFTRRDTRFHIYYLYGLERMCTLTGIKDFDGHDWYSEHAAPLIRQQRPDGRYEGECGVPAETSFAILFLSRATQKLLGKPEDRLAGGLMIGGRGLPSNLAAIQTSADGIKVRKLDAPVDKLLSELENPQSVQVESVQQAIVETVQIGDREKLIGQKERLKKLANDPRPEVRRTALWALGRCATVHDALVMVKALDDPDINVVIEANNALCWLSRRPNGFGHGIDPLANLPENASERQRIDAAQAWRAQIRNEWREWYNRVGDYSERDLPLDLP